MDPRTRNAWTPLRWKTLALILLGATVACREAPEPRVSAPRPVKAITIDSQATGAVRTFSGVIAASEVTALAFRVDGTVTTVDVNLGQRLRRGQVLATLDRTPYHLRLQQAQAELRRSQATLRERTDNLERTRSLFDAGARSLEDLDQAISEHESERSALASARAAVDLARRDLSDTVLEAPFDGVIAEKLVEAFEEVRAGHTAFVLHTSGAVELEVLIPESLIDQIQIGDPVSVQATSPALAGQRYSGRIKEIGSAAVEANAFPVQVAVEDDESRLRPGQSAQGTFTFPVGEGPSWLVPINAFLPKPGDDQTRPIRERDLTVFVVDSDTGTVSHRIVRVLDLRGNDVLVSEGLSEGDRVVVAGVSFLSEGQTVRVLEPD